MHRNFKHEFAIKFFALAIIFLMGWLTMPAKAFALCWDGPDEASTYPNVAGTPKPIAGFPNKGDLIPSSCENSESACALKGYISAPAYGCPAPATTCCLKPAKTLGCFNDYIGADRTTFTSATCVKNDAACVSPNKKLGDDHGCSDGNGGKVCCAIIGAASGGASKTPAAALPSGGSTAKWKFNNDQGTGIQLVPCTEDGNCTIENVVQQGINFAKWVMGLAGALFLLVFVYGGAMYVASFGRSDYVTKGKNALIRGAIGIVLVMSAWTIVSYVAASLGYMPVGTGSVADLDAACAKQHTGYSCMNVTPEQEKSQYLCDKDLCKSDLNKQYKCCIQTPTNK